MKGRKSGPPIHDDLVQREFVAAAPNELWLSDITDHWTGEDNLYLCAVKDVWSNRIVGRSFKAGNYSVRSPVMAWPVRWVA